MEPGSVFAFLVVRFFDFFLESSDRLTHASTKAWEAFRPKDQYENKEDDQQFWKTDTKGHVYTFL